MKTTIERDKYTRPSYPCIMVSCVEETEGMVVLFSAPSNGTVLHMRNAQDRSIVYHIGYYTNNFNMRMFKPFNGSITLTEGE